ncbi:MAG TPA: response regulator [Candidatus Acidoferrales bacterium]|nr:response regulator [Candidatus Acidoferrales bacterium]
MKYGELVVLLVEDDPDDVELTLHTFAEARITNPIYVVRDGQEALDYIFCRGAHAAREAIPPRLILLDLKLPKIGGLQVLQAIKADPRTKGIPVVILTSSREERDLIEGYQLGANSYIQKPVDFAQFQKTIREMGSYWLGVNQSTPVTI